MEKDIKPSDFFGPPPDTIAVNKLTMGLLLSSIQSYFRAYLTSAKNRKEKKPPTPQDLIMEPLLQDQLLQACVILFSQLPIEDRHALIKDAMDKVSNKPGSIPPLPKLEDLFK